MEEAVIGSSDWVRLGRAGASELARATVGNGGGGSSSARPPEQNALYKAHGGSLGEAWYKHRGVSGQRTTWVTGQ